ncbi:Hypothetical protein SSA_1422 [Streptococcus sanguinis SK36]|uniref:Uncharacterized protein n=1 Tax=Streptococcus sanguinis (strain SK36) TaxID=388919 RepID=A3CNR4_STRSV|nr:Hypothetical protein SSA_1422 [Streptococcus sanguinis SK36]
MQVISLKSECLGPMAQHVREKEVSLFELTEEEIIKNNQLNPVLNMMVYKWIRHDFSD